MRSEDKHRRITGRCTYCGARLRHSWLTCAPHSDLPARDPHHAPGVRQPLQQPPDSPVLILTRKAA